MLNKHFRYCIYGKRLWTSSYLKTPMFTQCNSLCERKIHIFSFSLFFGNDNALKKSDLISLFIFTSKLVIALSRMFYDELPWSNMNNSSNFSNVISQYGIKNRPYQSHKLLLKDWRLRMQDHVIKARNYSELS